MQGIIHKVVLPVLPVLPVCSTILPVLPFHVPICQKVCSMFRNDRHCCEDHIIRMSLLAPLTTPITSLPCFPPPSYSSFRSHPPTPPNKRWPQRFWSASRLRGGGSLLCLLLAGGRAIYGLLRVVVAGVSVQKNIENLRCRDGRANMGEESHFARQGMVERERLEKAVGWLMAVQRNSG